MTESVAQTPLRIDLVSDVVCPWCAIGLARLEAALALRDDLAVDLHWHPFLLNPDIPPEGRDMTAHIGAKYGKNAAEVAASQRQLVDVATELGLDFSGALTRRSFNTMTAHRVLHYAREQGVDDAFNRALFTAYFGRAENPNDVEVLVSIGRDLGLDPETIAEIVRSDRNEAPVRDEIETYQRQGISAVPSWIIESRYLISGAQPPDMMADALARIAAERVESADS